MLLGGGDVRPTSGGRGGCISPVGLLSLMYLSRVGIAMPKFLTTSFLGMPQSTAASTFSLNSSGYPFMASPGSRAPPRVRCALRGRGPCRRRSCSGVLWRSWRLHGPRFAGMQGVDVTLRYHGLLVLAFYGHPFASVPLHDVPRELRSRGMRPIRARATVRERGTPERASPAESMRVFFSRPTTAPPRRDRPLGLPAARPPGG